MERYIFTYEAPFSFKGITGKGIIPFVSGVDMVKVAQNAVLTRWCKKGFAPIDPERIKIERCDA